MATERTVTHLASELARRSEPNRAQEVPTPARSREPVTAEGKRNSSRNSLRHGLRAKILINDGRIDDERFAILSCYEQDLQPQSELERLLIEIIAFSYITRGRTPQPRRSRIRSPVLLCLGSLPQNRAANADFPKILRLEPREFG